MRSWDEGGEVMAELWGALEVCSSADGQRRVEESGRSRQVDWILRYILGELSAPYSAYEVSYQNKE